MVSLLYFGIIVSDTICWIHFFTLTEHENLNTLMKLDVRERENLTYADVQEMILGKLETLMCEGGVGEDYSRTLSPGT